MSEQDFQDLAAKTSPPHPVQPAWASAETHAKQKPIVFVIVALAAASLLLTASTVGVLYLYNQSRGIAEPLPDFAARPENRLDRPVVALAVELGPDEPGRLIVLDADGLHVVERIDELLHSRTVPLCDLRAAFPGPDAVGVSAERERLLVLCQEEPRRGIVAFTLPERVKDMKPWSRPVADVSYFPGIDDAVATSILVDPRARIRLVGGLGVGVQDIDRRSWIKTLGAAQGVSSERVHDLEFTTDSRLAIMGDKGIDFGTWANRDWTGDQHFDHANGLVGASIRHGRKQDGDLVYLTTGNGLGRIPLDGAARASRPVGLVWEGRAPGLSRESVQRVAEDRARQRVWIVYAASDADLQAAVYRGTEEHHLRPGDQASAWPKSPGLTVRADPYGKASAAWVGGNGVRRLREPESLTDPVEVRKMGLDGQQVVELSPTPGAVFAHGVNPAPAPGGSAHAVFAAPRPHLDERGGAAWAPFIGPRRFNGLAFDDLTGASNGSLDSRPVVFFATKGGKGIGAFDAGSRELYRAFHSKQIDGAKPCPEEFDSLLDIAATKDSLAAVGERRELGLFDGGKWVTLLRAGGIDIKPEDVRTVVANGKHLVVGSADKIGHYDADTHAWRSLPSLAGLDRLAVAVERLWGIDKDKKIHDFPLAAPKDGDAWKLQDVDLIDFQGDDEVAIVLAGKNGSTRLWVRGPDGEKKNLVSPVPLPSKGKPWAVAAAHGKSIYFAPHGDGIGHYDLATHQWKPVPLPTGKTGDVTRLAATDAALWLLDGEGTLQCFVRQTAEWRPAATRVRWLGEHGKDVIALTQTGRVLVSGTGTSPMTVLVGDAFDQPLADVRAAAVYKNSLFVATPKQIGRYDELLHSWQGYDPQAVPGATAFARTGACLYALGTKGQLHRWAEKDNKWADVQSGGKPVSAVQIAADGGGELFIRTPAGGLHAIADASPDAMRVLIAATKVGPGAITAAAERDRDLILGQDSGNVFGYGKLAANGPRVWYPMLEEKGAANRVRQLLPVPGQNDQIVAVRDDVKLLERAKAGSAWDARDLLKLKVQYGTVTKSDFYGFQAAADKNAPQVWQARLNGAATPAAPLIGAAFPGTGPTLGIGVADGKTVFRSDGEMTAYYNDETHAWVPTTIGKVRQFFSIGKELWAWVPVDQTLYRWKAPNWEADEGSRKRVRHAVGDGTAIAFVDVDGGVHIRDAQGVAAIIPNLPKPLGVKSVADLKALAQADDILFLAPKAANSPLLAYDAKKHQWKVHDEAKEVIEFARLKADTGQALFALQAGGAVVRYNAGSAAWEPVASVSALKVVALSAADDHIVCRTAEGLHAIDAAGEVKSKLLPRFLGAAKAADLEFAAAAELDGKLLLVPRDARSELLVYDPATAAWEKHELKGKPEHFLRSPAGLYLRTSDKGEIRLYSLTGNPLRPDISFTGLRDAISDGTSVWVITDESAVRRIDAKGALEKVIGIRDSALPKDRAVFRAFGAADACVVLLDDGSVHHYSATDREWVEKIAPLTAAEKAAAKIPGRLSRVGDHGAFVLVRPNLEIWVCEPGKKDWRQVKDESEIAKLPSPPAAATTSVWTVGGKEPEYQFEVALPDRKQVLKLEKGRFDWDRPTQLAREGDVLALNTAAGVRKYVSKKDGAEWQEQLQDVGAFPIVKVDPLTVAGKTFAVALDAKGAFRTPAGQASIRLAQGAEWATLLPTERGGEAGFAHDDIRDAAWLDKSWWLATPGGAVRYKVAGAAWQREQIAGTAQGLSRVDLDAVLVSKGRLLARSKAGAYWQKKDGWEKAEAAKEFEQARGLERDNASLDGWTVTTDAAGIKLSLRVAGTEVPVSLSAGGFGFDQPRALALTEKALRLFTPDGAIGLGRQQAGVVTAADEARKLPAFEGFADVIDGPETWLRTIDKPAAWQFSAKAWAVAKVNEYDAVLNKQQPYFADADGIKWDRANLASFQLAHLNGGKPFTARYLPAVGRFQRDVPLAVGTSGNDVWVATAEGTVRLDAQNRWAEIALPEAAIDDKSRFRSLPGKRFVLETGAKKLFERLPAGWGEPADAAKVAELIREADESMLRGEAWLLGNKAVAARQMKVKFDPKREWAVVALDETGLFDFEDVRSVVDDNNDALIAARFGLVRYDTKAADLVEFWKQASPGVRIGRLDAERFAQLADKSVLKYDADKATWNAAAEKDIFDKIDARLVKAGSWSWERKADKLAVELSADQNGIWAGPGALAVGLIEGRFHFDTALDVGLTDQSWLATAAGLLPRNGKQIGAPEAIKLAAGDPAKTRTMFTVVPDAQRVLYVRAADGLLARRDGKWERLSAEDAKAAETLLTSQETKSASFDVARGKGLDVKIRPAHDPADPYKRVAFNGDLGAFTFDDLKCVGRYAKEKSPQVLVGTAGGTARYASQGADGDALLRLYCEEAADGMGLIAVTGIVRDVRKGVNYAASAAPVQHFRLGDAKWERGAEADKDQYERLRRLTADDPDGWQVDRDSKLVPPFKILWKGQPAKLIDLLKTGDSSASVTRFAHDVPLSVALSGPDLWVATRGGIVRFPGRPQGDDKVEIQFGRFELYSEQTLTVSERGGTEPPRGTDWVKADRARPGRVYARRSDGSILTADAAAPGAWSPVPLNDPGYRSAAIVAGDPVLKWVKDSFASLRPEFDKTRLRVPADYAWLTNGTWSFLETGHVARRDPQQTMVPFEKHFYAATAGGVTCFEEPPADAPKDPAGVDFIRDLFAVARAPQGDVPMRDIVQLFVDPKAARLFARSEKGEVFAYDAQTESWAKHGGTDDPLAAANVVVDSELLRVETDTKGTRWTVKPLSADMPDQSAYPLFHDGRFAFDVVHSYAIRDGQFWLATEGGVCAYSRGSFAPGRFFAAGLPRVREIAASATDGHLACRTAAGETRRFEAGRWQPADEAETFLAAYTRTEDNLLRFVQYPEGGLEAVTKDVRSPAILGTKRGRSPLPLFSNNRFSFDDVRAVVLHGDGYWSSTPVGVTFHELDWATESTRMVRLDCFAATEDGVVPMAGLERLVGTNDRSLLAWGNSHVFALSSAPDSAGWRVEPSLRGDAMRDRMLLGEKKAGWVLKRQSEADPTVVIERYRGGELANSRSAQSRYRAADLSQAAMDDRWIYLPRTGGGIVRIDKDRVR